jgi:hypothetical protein
VCPPRPDYPNSLICSRQIRADPALITTGLEDPGMRSSGEEAARPSGAATPLDHQESGHEDIWYPEAVKVILLLRAFAFAHEGEVARHARFSTLPFR